MHPFRAAIEARDLDAAVALMSEDVVFRSPVVHRPYEGRDAVMTILRAVGQVLEDFQYTREIGAPEAADHALVFRARIGDREVEAKPGSVVYIPSNMVHSGGATPEADVVFFTVKDASHGLHGIRQQSALDDQNDSRSSP